MRCSEPRIDDARGGDTIANVSHFIPAKSEKTLCVSPPSAKSPPRWCASSMRGGFAWIPRGLVAGVLDNNCINHFQAALGTSVTLLRR